MLSVPHSDPPSADGNLVADADLVADRRLATARLVILSSLLVLMTAQLAWHRTGGTARIEGLPAAWRQEQDHIGRVCSAADRVDDTAAYLTCRELGLLH